MTVDEIAKEITAEILAEETARERVRLNPDAPKGSDTDLIRLLLSALDNAHAALNETLAIGQSVRMADDAPYIGDWRGWTGFVSGIRADNETGKISYEVSDVWPPTSKSGRTDGCYNLVAV